MESGQVPACRQGQSRLPRQGRSADNGDMASPVGPAAPRRAPAGMPNRSPKAAFHWKEHLDRSLRTSRQQRLAGRSSPPVARTGRARRRRAVGRARVDPHARRGFRRPLLPVFADGKLEPRGRHRQGGFVQHRPRRRHSRRARRKAGLRVLRRHFARRLERSGGRRARDRTPGAVRGRARSGVSATRIRSTRPRTRSPRCRKKPRSRCSSDSSEWRERGTRAWRR